MEQVFDLREFLIGFWKKGKMICLFTLIVAILGGAFGWYRFPNEDIILSSSTATVNAVDKTQDSTSLSSAMTMVNSYLTSDTFYTELLNEVTSTLSEEKALKLFHGDTTPSLKDVKDIIKVQTKGNIVIVEVKAANETLPVETAELCISYITSNIAKYNPNIMASMLGTEVVNITKQNNETLLKEIGLFSALGAVAGIGISLLFVFFVNVFSVNVTKPDDLKCFKLPVLCENANRTAAVILATINREDNITLALSSTANIDVMVYATELKQALLNTGNDYSVIDVRKADYAHLKEIINTAKEVNKSILLCCDNVNTSSDAMFQLSLADYALLCEQKKVSHIDEIAKALEQISNLKTYTIGLVLK